MTFAPRGKAKGLAKKGKALGMTKGKRKAGSAMTDRSGAPMKGKFSNVAAKPKKQKGMRLY